MAGCFGGSAEDRHFQKQLDNYLDACDHLPKCDMAEEGDMFNEDGTPYEKVCTCDELNKDDKVEAQLTRLGM